MSMRSIGNGQYVTEDGTLYQDNPWYIGPNEEGFTSQQYQVVGRADPAQYFPELYSQESLKIQERLASALKDYGGKQNDLYSTYLRTGDYSPIETAGLTKDRLFTEGWSLRPTAGDDADPSTWSSWQAVGPGYKRGMVWDGSIWKEADRSEFGNWMDKNVDWIVPAFISAVGGAAVGGAAGGAATSAGASSSTAATVGSTAGGATQGGLSAAMTDGDIGQGMLTGAIAGGAGGIGNAIGGTSGAAVGGALGGAGTAAATGATSSDIGKAAITGAASGMLSSEISQSGKALDLNPAVTSTVSGAARGALAGGSEGALYGAIGGAATGIGRELGGKTGAQIGGMLAKNYIAGEKRDDAVAAMRQRQAQQQSAMQQKYQQYLNSKRTGGMMTGKPAGNSNQSRFTPQQMQQLYAQFKARRA